mmetsp:Transcript_21796/g.55034  ORF Transcript_21796/g.55034 Transcript_21796/m.55034 type:complete len:284 (-) Transcript_21796:451-1302(-)
MSSLRHWSTRCHRWLTMLSLLPGSSLAMSAKRLPSLCCAATMRLSSSSVHLSRRRVGSTLPTYRALHCLGILPGSCFATMVHLPRPCSSTSLARSASSSRVQGFLRSCGGGCPTPSSPPMTPVGSCCTPPIRSSPSGVLRRGPPCARETEGRRKSKSEAVSVWSTSSALCWRTLNHRSLTALSLLPWRRLLISCHLLPSLLCAATILRSSSSVHAVEVSDGSSLFRYRSLHLLGCLPSKCCAMVGQLPSPISSTSLTSSASSSSDHSRRSFFGASLATSPRKS